MRFPSRHQFPGNTGAEFCKAGCVAASVGTYDCCKSLLTRQSRWQTPAPACETITSTIGRTFSTLHRELGNKRLSDSFEMRRVAIRDMITIENLLIAVTVKKMLRQGVEPSPRRNREKNSPPKEVVKRAGTEIAKKFHVPSQKTELSDWPSHNRRNERRPIGGRVAVDRNRRDRRRTR
ncbi:uncharacterized protein LOC117218696 [Megalopta genalis]|uniref:uncharacterized protein LOC117218696 n=1 Tax=Megalopta genalis TaxID=115081 RepID=UPI003FD3D878